MSPRQTTIWEVWRLAVAPCLSATPNFFLENVIYTQTFEYRVNTVVKDNTVKFPIVTGLFIQLTSPQTLNPIHSSPSRQKQRPPPTKRCGISDGPPRSTPGFSPPPPKMAPGRKAATKPSTRRLPEGNLLIAPSWYRGFDLRSGDLHGIHDLIIFCGHLEFDLPYILYYGFFDYPSSQMKNVVQASRCSFSVAYFLVFPLACSCCPRTWFLRCSLCNRVADVHSDMILENRCT
jgi:hypothetical protein